MTTVVCVPSRGRPGNITQLGEAIAATAASDVVLYVYVDDDDPSDYRASDNTIVERGVPRRLVPAWNYQATRVTQAHQVCFWGDDVVPETPGWDTTLWEESAGGQVMVYGSDGYWDNYLSDTVGHLVLPTAVTMSPRIITALGAAVPSPVEHLYADNTWRALGLAAGRLRYVPQVMIRHHHPTHSDPIYRSMIDDTYSRGGTSHALFEADRDRFEGWRSSPAFHNAVNRLRNL